MNWTKAEVIYIAYIYLAVWSNVIYCSLAVMMQIYVEIIIWVGSCVPPGSLKKEEPGMVSALKFWLRYILALCAIAVIQCH